MPNEPSIAQAERRLHQRHSAELPVQLQTEDSPTLISCRTSNLSLYGCSIMLKDQLTLGVRLRIELSLPGRRAAVYGRVITRHPQFGNGIMFLRFEEDGEQHLRKFLEEIRA